jgi:uncharacterized surface protein with fasciclin (FAS1) repeats
MRTPSTLRRTGLAAAAITLTFTMAACGSEDEPASGGTSADDTTSDTSDETTDDAAADDAEAEGGTEPAAATLVGPGCAGYAEAVPNGAGSVSGMAQDPVATAASNNPLLKTLVAAVSGKLNPKVNLVDTLNGGEFTVFAPVDDAFAALPPAAVKDLAKPANADALTQVLTYHVVEGQLAPEQVVGTQTSVQGGDVKVTGSGDNLKVNDASVICGGVTTANATVYLIDSVLMPPAMN